MIKLTDYDSSIYHFWATWKLFSVTNPELKRAFRKTGALNVLKLALNYPTAQEVAKVTQQTMIPIPQFDKSSLFFIL
jgi:hypothetical protein